MLRSSDGGEKALRLLILRMQERGNGEVAGKHQLPRQPPGQPVELLIGSRALVVSDTSGAGGTCACR